jgi:hypothetical protein
VVAVPPYIGMRVELRSADGRGYALRFGRRSVRSSGRSVFLAGLLPGREVVGRPVGGSGTTVRVTANAEPGP